GGALGAAGGTFADVLAVSTRPFLPWLMAAALALPALGLDKRLGRLPLVGTAAAGAARISAKFSETARSAAMGALTPLLPCGLLYGIFVAALVSGSFATGALVLASFALGAVPALLAAQLHVRLLSRLPGRLDFVLKRVVPLAAAAVMVWRGVKTPNACH
ncbi:MAG: sulfite exporter TauE/SafE family protein, partial [Myxococcales bacterium]